MKNINLGMIKALTGYVIELIGVGNSGISQKNKWKNLQIVVVKYWRGDENVRNRKEIYLETY